MKRTIIGAASVLAFVAITIGVLPAPAEESREEEPGAQTAIDEPTSGDTGDPWATGAGETLAFSLEASDADSDPLTYAAYNLPPGATFDPLTATFSWTPGYDQAGVYPDICFEVSDGELTASENITITVIDSKALVIPVSALKINPATVNPGKPVIVRASLTNTGPATAVYEAVLQVNGSVASTQIVALPAGETGEVKFTIVRNIPGEYAVDVNGSAGTFTVRSSEKVVPRSKFLSYTVGWLRRIVA